MKKLGLGKKKFLIFKFWFVKKRLEKGFPKIKGCFKKIGILKFKIPKCKKFLNLKKTEKKIRKGFLKIKYKKTPVFFIFKFFLKIPWTAHQKIPPFFKWWVFIQVFKRRGGVAKNKWPQTLL